MLRWILEKKSTKESKVESLEKLLKQTLKNHQIERKKKTAEIALQISERNSEDFSKTYLKFLLGNPGKNLQ